MLQLRLVIFVRQHVPLRLLIKLLYRFYQEDAGSPDVAEVHIGAGDVVVAAALLLHAVEVMKVLGKGMPVQNGDVVTAMRHREARKLGSLQHFTDGQI